MSLIVKSDYKYHLVFSHDDADGVVGAFLIKNEFDNNMENESWERNVHVIHCNYDSKYDLSFFKQKTAEYIEEVKKMNGGESNASISVYMIDYAMKPNEDVNRFYVWLKMMGIEFNLIDHHLTAIQNLHSYNIPGLQDITYSGTMNVYRFLKGDPNTAPKLIKMISDFDIHKEDTEYSFENQLYPLVNYISSLGMTLNDNSSELVKMLKALLIDEQTLDTCIATYGKAISNYVNAKKEKKKPNVYVGYLDKYKCLVLNSESGGRGIFDGHPEENTADLFVTWYFDGKTYKYSVFSKNKMIDVGLLCERLLNGGGHYSCGGGESAELLIKSL